MIPPMIDHVALPRRSPESQGLRSRGIDDFLRALDESAPGMHAFMLLRRGAVVAEGEWRPCSAASRHALFSLSKSFASMAVGLAAAEGLVSIDDEVLSFFPGRAPKAVSPNLRAMRVRHLLSMTTGHAADPTRAVLEAADPVAAFLAAPVELEPGSRFLYDTSATFMLSAILQEVTGKRLLDYLEPRLLEPLGIVGATWERHGCGVDLGGVGLALRLEDVARFGQLLLDRGEWAGRRLLPEAWIEEATALQVRNDEGGDPGSDWAQGYGFQFWRCARPGAYRADGAFGQFCVVLPGEDMIFAAFGGLADMQAPLRSLWEGLPAMLPGAEHRPGPRGELPPDPDGEAALRERCAGLSLAVPRGSSAPAPALPGRAYLLEPNALGLAEVSLDFGPRALSIRYRVTRESLEAGASAGPAADPRALAGPPRLPPPGDHELTCGYGEWRSSGGAAAAGAWSAPGRFRARVLQLGTPFCLELDLSLSGASLACSAALDVSFGEKALGEIKGLARAPA